MVSEKAWEIDSEKRTWANKIQEKIIAARLLTLNKGVTNMERKTLEQILWHQIGLEYTYLWLLLEK